MERKIGEIFTCNGKLYQVVKGFSCNGCAFIKNGDCYLVDKLLGPCASKERTDKTSVIFKLINNMERKIGEIFTYKGKTYQVVKSNTCRDCTFFSTRCNSLQTLVTGTCTPGGRKDNINVAFKEINNIENNQLTIDITEGYEIDKENSTFKCIKFKPIKKYLTYKEIAEKLNKDICFFIAKGKIQSYAQYASYDNPGVANSYRQIEKILAINQLMNIAKYYNGDWKPNWSNSKENKFCIKFDYHKDRLYVDYNNSIGAGDVFFKNSEDARTVINNPNFRNILDVVYKN